LEELEEDCGLTEEPARAESGWSSSSSLDSTLGRFDEGADDDGLAD
jgi:hypothetical protein